VGELPAAGLYPFDLTGHHCPECGQPKLRRLMLTGRTCLTGCAACDAVILAHRCTGRPDIDTLFDGDQWKCPACGLVWTARVELVVSEEREWSARRETAS